MWNRNRRIAILGAILVTGTTGEYKSSRLYCRNHNVDYLPVSVIISAQSTRMEEEIMDDLGPFYADHVLKEMVVGQWAVWAMSLGSNILATILIGYKA